MKIVILNGSPKGEYSNTIHYMKYIMKHRPGHEYKVIEAGRDIKKIEKEAAIFGAFVDDVRSADALIWSFPLYHLSAPSQLMRLIELIEERGAAGVFREKYGTALTTSVHFFDHLAHNYIHAVSEDLGMLYVDGFSAGMRDIREPEQKRQLLLFFDHFVDAVKENAPTARKYAPLVGSTKEYLPGELKKPVAIGGKKITLVTDALESDVNLSRMIEVFRKSVDGPVDIVNLNKIKILGGCLGCIHCGYDNVCVYNDDLRSLYVDRIAASDAVVFAGSLRGRSLSSRWKTFWDRSFFKGHCPLVEGAQFGYLISGPLRQLPDVREELEARPQMSRGNLAGIVTDEYDDPAQVTALIQRLAADIARGMETGYCRPQDYLGVGGHLVLRDLIYSISGVFQADDRYYKEHGLYDYPQKDYRARMFATALKVLTRSDRIRKEFYKRATAENAKEYQKAIDAD